MYDFTKINDAEVTFLIPMEQNFNSKLKTTIEGDLVVGDYTNTKAESYELLYVADGDYYTTYGDQTFHMQKDCVLFLPKRTEKLQKYQVKIPCDKIVNKKSTIDIFFETKFSMPTDAFIIDASKNSNVGSNFKKLKTEWNIKQPGAYHKCIGYLYLIFAELENLKRVNYISNSQYNRIKPAIDYIYEHCFDNDFEYLILPKLCGVGYSYFKRIFKLKYGKSPSQFIISKRMAKASELIISGMYSITEISKMVGYSDIYYFSKVFKSYFGCSPSFYKSKIEK